MANRTERVTVGTTRTEMTKTESGRLDQRLLIRPVGGVIFIGDDTVTSATGFQINDGESFDETTSAPVVSFAASGTVTVRVYRGGVR